MVWLVRRKPANQGERDLSVLPPGQSNIDRGRPGEIVRGQPQYMSKVVARSNTLPIIMLWHGGWRDRAPEAWRLLREAIRTAGEPIGLACIDQADPANALDQRTLIKMRSRESLDLNSVLPFLGIMVVEQVDRWGVNQSDEGLIVSQHAGDSLAAAIATLVERAVFVFYGASALGPSHRASLAGPK